MTFLDEIKFDSKLKKEEALDFYKSFILNKEKMDLLQKYSFKVNGSVSFQDWELFAAILTDNKKAEGYGADLNGFEVKSASEGSGFEYQYHKIGGASKLQEDMKVAHIFISYSDTYENVTVRLVEPQHLEDSFRQWDEELKLNYAPETGKQRFRKTIPFKRVCEVGTVIFEIKNGNLI